MKRATLIILFSVLLLQMILRLPFLAEPLNLDEATYATIANRLSQGEVLYRDMVDVKPPGIFHIYQLIGRDPFILRLITACFSLLLTLTIFFIGKKILNERLGLAAAVLYALFSGGVFIEGTQANPETFMLLPLLLALLCFLSEGFFWAGLFSGMAMMIKQTAAFNFLGLALFLAWMIYKKRRSPVALFGLLGGFAAFFMLFFIYLGFQGVLPDFINAVFFYSWGMVKPSSTVFLVKTGFLFLFENSVLWILAILGAIFFGPHLLLVWTVASLLGVYAAGFALGHYYIQVIPSLCLLGGLAIVKWRELKLSPSTKSILLVLIAALALFMVVSEYEFYLYYDPDGIAAERYGTPINGLARKIGLKIKERTAPGDLVYGISSVVYYSGRNTLTKYYLTVQGGRTELVFLGRKIYRHDFGVQRDPELKNKVDEDFYRNLSDPRTKYWAVNLKDNYAPRDIRARLKEYHFGIDHDLSDPKNDILVFKRK